MKKYIFISIVLFIKLNLLYGQNWDSIEKVTFNGFQNPNLTDSIYETETLDAQLMSRYFLNAKKSNQYFPKGASIFLTIYFKNNEKFIVQFIAGGYDIFHVITADNNFTSDWYKLDSSHKDEWNEIIKSRIK